MKHPIFIATFTAVLIVTLIPVTKQVDTEVKVKQHKEYIKPPKPPKPTKATWSEKKANKRLAMRYAHAGWGWDLRQQECVYNIFMRESRFDHLAKNQEGSTAYGIGQMLNERSSNPDIQILHAYKYIKHRYTTPCNAWNHHLRRNWY